ncbi:ATP-binding protein [bacterium]|nr:ATP-binding protein [bacterium]
MKGTRIYKVLQERESYFIAKIDDLVPIVKDRLATQVPKIFPEYTLHNLEHSIRVAEYIPDLVTDIKKFNDFELALMLLSALLHDLGMALGKQDIASIKNDNYSNTENVKFLVYEKLYGEKALPEIIRQYHAEFSSTILETDENYRGKFVIQEPRGVSFCEDLCLLCMAHTKDNLWIIENVSDHNIKGEYDYNLRYIAYLLRIADMLDIDQSRTPYELYTLINPKGLSDTEWRQHFTVTNIKKVEENKRTGKNDIVFYGESSDIKIHRKLLTYVKWLNEELGNFNEFCLQLDNDKFTNHLSDRVLTRIKTKGFTISDYKLSLDFKSITELLMGENIYGDKRIGLREIVQNSIDACLVRKEIEIKRATNYTPLITIRVNNDTNSFTISDNGIGMSEEIIKKFFLNIGKSYYKSDLFKLNDLEYKPIGAFGIGFLACFMLSEDVKIESRYYKESVKHTIQLERADEFIAFNSVEDVGFEGTRIHMMLDQVLREFGGDVDNVLSFVNEYFVNDDYEMTFEIDTEKKKIDNSVQKSERKEKNTVIVDVSNYIEDATGHFIVKNTHQFVREVEDLSISTDHVYLLEDGELTENHIEICRLVDVDKNELSYMHLPLFKKSIKDEFDKVFEILDDIDETMNRIESVADIYVFYPVFDQSTLVGDIVTDMSDVYFFGDLLLSDLVEKVSDDYFCPVVKIETVTVFPDEKNRLLVQYGIFNNTDYRWFGSWSRINKEVKLYLRNILIKNYLFNKQTMAKAVSLQSMALNIYSKKIISDISRNDLLPEAKKTINNTLNIAMHLAALDNFDLEPEEKDILKKFVTDKLFDGSNLIREDALNGIKSDISI